ncbi:MAG: hypothetical protein M1839_002984 [Geoglossum umbratile]|nr:MAG: hypothetical protein M1839_002984 [Geoglossum umbratile]
MTSSFTSPLPTFLIPYLTIAGFLQLAEAHQQVSESGDGAGRMKLPPGMKLLKRSASPEEISSPQRESEFAESEEREEVRATNNDETYGKKRATKGRGARSPCENIEQESGS